MQIVGLYFSSLQPNSISPSSKLIAHLSRKFPEQEHRPYHLEHRLFVDTSSQLPGSDLKKRAYTQILTWSDASNIAFVGSTKPDPVDDIALVTISSTSVDSFTNLILTKLQPQWFHRQSVSVEGGTSVSFKDGEYKISIGDVRISGRSQPGAGSLRGVIIEICHFESTEDEVVSEDATRANTKQEQQTFGALLGALFRDTGESFDASKIAVRQIPNSESSKDAKVGAKSPEWEIAKLYMEVLRGSRG